MDLGLLQAKEEPNSIKYRDGMNIKNHFYAMCTAWSKANNQGAEINNKRFRAYIIKSMPSSWVPITGALFDKQKSVDIIFRLTPHVLLLHSPSAMAPTNTVHALAIQTTLACSNKSSVKCKNLNCGWVGHTKERCF